MVRLEGTTYRADRKSRALHLEWRSSLKQARILFCSMGNIEHSSLPRRTCATLSNQAYVFNKWKRTVLGFGTLFLGLVLPTRVFCFFFWAPDKARRNSVNDFFFVCFRPCEHCPHQESLCQWQSHLQGQGLPAARQTGCGPARSATSGPPYVPPQKPWWSGLAVAAHAFCVGGALTGIMHIHTEHGRWSTSK